MAKYLYDESQFNEKYDRYSSLIYRTAYQYLLNSDSAEDITQEVFVKLFTNRRKFNDDEHEKAWLLRVTINLCKNLIKSKEIKNAPLNDELSNDGSSFEESSDIRIDMKRHIELLSPEQRAIIYLYYFEGFTVKEISKITATKENTVKSHLKRAREKLKSSIERE